MVTAGIRTGRAAQCIFVLLCIAGCSTDSVSRHIGDMHPAAVQEFELRDSLSPSFVEVIRRAAEDGGEFRPQRTGAEFASDLPNHRCGPEGNAALLDPAWQASGQEMSLDSSAYCLYRLKLIPAQQSGALTLEWEGDAPSFGTCWIGLSDWQRSCWVWQVLPKSNVLDIAEYKPFVSPQDHCYAAVVLLEDSPHLLRAIGFGSDEPPALAQYNLYAPMQEWTTYLTDMQGNIVHSWLSDYRPAASVYLLENGHLLRTSISPSRKIYFAGGGGLIEEFNWDGERVWWYEHSTNTTLIHHDIEPLPNGHILAVAWVKRTAQEMIDLGRNPETMSFGSLYVDSVIEIVPQLGHGGEIVWEWQLTDHLVQDFDPEKPSYDSVSSHPELVDVNYTGGGTDWTHINSVDYNAELDQIVLSVHGFDELWIIDHSTTTAEAAAHDGGIRGRGGDLLYRWGNPRTYNGAAFGQQKCFGQHDVQWIPAGYPGAGNLLLFNNRFDAPPDPEWPYSTVLELVPPLNGSGNYDLVGEYYGPAEPEWEFRYDPLTDMFSGTMSGCQRLPDGNTLICCAESGWVLEVTAAGELAWDYEIGTSVFRAARYREGYSGLANL